MTEQHTLWGREPALILSAVQAVLALGVGFGLPVTSEQTALILAASAAIIGVLIRSQVTPTTKVAASIEPPPDTPVAGPASHLDEGTPVEIIEDTGWTDKR